MTPSDATFVKRARGELSRSGISDEKEITDRLAKMIDYAIKRHDWYDDQRNKVLSLGVALLGLSSFLVSGLISSNSEHFYYFRAFGCLCLAEIVFISGGIIALYAYGSTRDYTHRKLVDIRSWYPAYVLSSEVVSAAIYDVNAHELNLKKIGDAWAQFIVLWSDFARAKNGFLIEDLEQVFVLFLLQGIKRNNLRLMLAVAYTGGLALALTLLATIFAAGFRM